MEDDEFICDNCDEWCDDLTFADMVLCPRCYHEEYEFDDEDEEDE